MTFLNSLPFSLKKRDLFGLNKRKTYKSFQFKFDCFSCTNMKTWLYFDINHCSVENFIIACRLWCRGRAVDLCDRKARFMSCSLMCWSVLRLDIEPHIALEVVKGWCQCSASVWERVSLGVIVKHFGPSRKVVKYYILFTKAVQFLWGYKKLSLIYVLNFIVENF